jgi:phospholipase/carboxylesterase
VTIGDYSGMSVDHITARGTRREFVHGCAIACGALITGCRGEPPTGVSGSPRIIAVPGEPTVRGATGKSAFSAGATEALIYVPGNATWDTPLGMMVFLHGALRTVEEFVEAFRPAAEQAGVIVLAPYARAATWDAIRGDFGPDPVGIQNVMLRTFQRWRVDQARISLAGFSDGGTYALSIGLANGDTFPNVAAFSPGFFIDTNPVGKPKFFITHGTQDTVLIIDGTREIIVAELRARGYEVEYKEFDGPHAVPLLTANAYIARLGAGSGT